MLLGHYTKFTRSIHKLCGVRVARIVGNSAGSPTSVLLFNRNKNSLAADIGFERCAPTGPSMTQRYRESFELAPINSSDYTALNRNAPYNTDRSTRAIIR